MLSTIVLLNSLLSLYRFLQAINIFLLSVRFNVALAFQAKIGLATRAVKAALLEIFDFAIVAVLALAVLAMLLAVLFGCGSDLPQVRKIVAFCMLPLKPRSSRAPSLKRSSPHFRAPRSSAPRPACRRSYKPPGGPLPVDLIDNGISYLLLVYVTAQTVATWSPELLPGAAGLSPRPWQNLTVTQEFSVFLTKIVLPVATSWILKKFFWVIVYQSGLKVAKADSAKEKGVFSEARSAAHCPVDCFSASSPAFAPLVTTALVSTPPALSPQPPPRPTDQGDQRSPQGGVARVHLPLWAQRTRRRGRRRGRRRRPTGRARGVLLPRSAQGGAARCGGAKTCANGRDAM